MAQLDINLVLESIAANIRELRAIQDLTQAALAELAEIDVTYEQRVERASVNVSIGVLVSIANAFDVPIGRLLLPAKLGPRPVGRPKLK